MRLSYKKLAQLISEMPEDRQEDDVTVLVGDELFAAKGIGPVENFPSVDGVLDPGHQIIHFG